MASSPMSQILRATVIGTFFVAGFTVMFLMYYKSYPSPKCYPSPVKQGKSQQTNKPVLLLWFWPENRKFDFQDCKKLFKIDGCHLTDDKSLYSKAQGVLVYHRAIQDDLSNLPTEPRSRLQRWIWFNMDSPNNTRKIAGIEGLFNLTMTYKKDADIPLSSKFSIRNNLDGDFVLPKKKRFLCLIVDGDDLDTKSEERYDYYRELVKHIKVDVFNRSSAENYFQIISSCKFYLSFEDFTDYVTETFSRPLAAGTVPIVLGPPRSDYEDSAPGSSFIHVNDFNNVTALAEFLLGLDDDDHAYMRYFDWRKFFTPTRHFTEEKNEFAYAICQACRHVGLYKNFRVVPDLYKWFFK